jgi:hypothetical protein
MDTLISKCFFFILIWTPKGVKIDGSLSDTLVKL